MANMNNVAITALQKLTGASSGAGAATPADNGGGPSFGDVLKTSLNSAITAQHTSEKVSAASLVGKADMTEVLQAVNNAEVALNTVLAVRDRVVQAYESIMRTSI